MSVWQAGVMARAWQAESGSTTCVDVELAIVVDFRLYGLS